MQFRDFQTIFTQHSRAILEHGNLFVLDVDKDLLWETYLESFPPQYNPVFRQRREYDCSCCRHFIKQYGALAAITDDYRLVTLWDFDTNDDCFQPVLEAMRELLQTHVSHAFFTKSSKLGTKVTYEQLEKGMLTWNHLYLDVPDGYVTNDIADAQEEKRAVKSVFKRSLEELHPDSIATTLEMIEENILYRGEEWKGPLQKFQRVQSVYLNVPQELQDNFAWRVSDELGAGLAKIKNHSIGTLLTDLSNGMDVDAALRRWENVMAPTNYKRPKAVFTQRMIEEAKQTVMELGLENSLGRRFAVLSDITVNNVLWANRNARRGSKGLDVFEQLKDETPINPNSLKNLPTMHIQDFLASMNGIKSLEVLFEGAHVGNLMSLIAPQDVEAPSLFKWDNNFSWAYNGNVTDSMKQQVKAAGGKVDGVLRFSIRWNENGDNHNDYDAHCQTPTNEIFFGNKQVGDGRLDVDIIHPTSQVAVENITWPDHRLRTGLYQFWVHNYSHRGGTDGFDAEIEMDGELYSFCFRKDFRGTVRVADITWDGQKFSIYPYLEPGYCTSSRQVWNMATNQFQPVSVVMFSPNYWDGQGVGNRHYFFMLNDCLNDGTPNGFYNEFLNEQLNPYRKVFEALGGRMKVASSDQQLSGLGFSSTQRAALIARINGQHLTKIIF